MVLSPFCITAKGDDQTKQTEKNKNKKTLWKPNTGNIPTWLNQANEDWLDVDGPSSMKKFNMLIQNLREQS